MALRAFRTTFICAIDRDEIDDDEVAEPTLDEVKSYLEDALVVDFDTENNGNPVGLQSVEVHIEQLTELPPDEVKKLYKTPT